MTCCLAQFQSLNLFLTPRLARYLNCPAGSEAPRRTLPRASGMVDRRLHGEFSLWQFIRTQLLIAQVLYSLRRLRRNCDVRVDQPGSTGIDVHVTVDFRGQLSTRQRYGRNEGHQVWALRRRSLRKPHCPRGEVVLDGASTDGVGIRFAARRLSCEVNASGTASRECEESHRQGPKHDLFQVVTLLHWISIRDRFHRLWPAPRKLRQFEVESVA